MAHEKRNWRREGRGLTTFKSDAITFSYYRSEPICYETDCPKCGKEWTVEGICGAILAPICPDCRTGGDD